MEARETRDPGPERLHSSVPHPWTGRDVQDPLTGKTGTLMDVRVEPDGRDGRHDVAYIRGGNAREFTIPAAQMRLNT